MSKILISWSAFNNDFTWLYRGTPNEQKDKVKEDGPTFTVHKFFGKEYDKHILLNSSDKIEDKKNFDLLVSELNSKFKYKIDPRTIVINDPINISEIFTKVSELLLEFKNCDVEIFVNPGTPQMQIAWYLVKPNFKRNVTLFQIRDAKFTKDKIPERIYSNIETNFNPTVTSIANEIISRNSTENRIFIPKTLEPIYEKAKLIAQTNNVGCLILGENGTGKENLASHIHLHSSRANREFKTVNCAAYSDDLLMSELFGHERGAFTGANEKKIGVFEVANRGTIFLDEIGDISPKMQVSLLRVLQEKKIQRVGSSNDISIDIRVIAATNKDLEALCESGVFRWDLFFRLAVTTLTLPSLRDWRKDEIRKLIEHFNIFFLSDFTNRQHKLVFPEAVLDRLLSYNFKGNIRELQNLIISFYTFCADEVKMENLPDRIINNIINPTSKDENEREHIRRVFIAKKGNVTLTAETLGIARETLYRKLKKFGLQYSK